MKVGLLRWKLTKFSLLVIQTEEINLRGKTMKMVRSVAKSVKTHTIGHLDAEVTLKLSLLGLDCCNWYFFMMPHVPILAKRKSLIVLSCRILSIMTNDFN